MTMLNFIIFPLNLETYIFWWQKETNISKIQMNASVE